MKHLRERVHPLLRIPALTVVCVAVAVTFGQIADACQVEGTGCSVTIPCCSGLNCVVSPPIAFWGFCLPGSSATPPPTNAPASTPRPTPTSRPSNPSTRGLDVHNGDGTFYDVGMGACGWVNSDSELVAAVSVTIYGDQANPNTAPICGQCALVFYQGHSVKVMIVDKCMGCAVDDIDMSPTAFAQLADQSLGRIKVQWTIVAC